MIGEGAIDFLHKSNGTVEMGGVEWGGVGWGDGGWGEGCR